MSEDDLGDLDAEFAAQAAAPLVKVIPPEVFIEDMERLAPLVDALVSGFAAGRVFMGSPEQRRQLAVLWNRITAVTGTLSAASHVIETAFKNQAIEQGAKQIPVPGMLPVRFEQPRGSYTGDWATLRTELRRMALETGIPPLEDVERALREERVITPDHRVLNSLKDRYGGEVAETIDRLRQFIVPPPETGRVRMPAVKEEPPHA